MKSRVIRFLILGGCLGVMIPLAGAVSFDPDAAVGDRLVELAWQPDADDPVFTGNLKLFPRGDTHLGAGALRFLSITRDGQAMWAWDDGLRSFVLVGQDALGAYVALDTLSALDQSLTPITFATHSLGAMLIAGLEDGRVAIWRPQTTDDWSLESGHDGACRAIAFRPLAGERDSTYVTVGDDGLWKRWSRPGVIQDSLPPDGEATFPEGLTAVGLDRRSDRLAIGSATGRVYMTNFSPTATIDNIEEHDGRAITGFTFSENSDRMASASEDGVVVIWSTTVETVRGKFQPEEESGIFIAYTPGHSRYVTYALTNGTLGFIDGFSARAYGAIDNLGREISCFALSTEGVVGFYGGPSGEFEWWYQGRCIPSDEISECFGGYQIFRGLYPDEETERLTLLRVYDFSDTTWGWTSTDTLRMFVDPDSVISADGEEDRLVAGPHNGIPHYYSIVKYYWRFLDGAVHLVPSNLVDAGFFRRDGETEPSPILARVDAVTTKPLLGDVYVVPNPYLEGEETSTFGPLSPPLVRLFNLPGLATIRIYSIGGDLVRRLEHEPTPGDTSGGSCPWDLKNEHDQDVVAGVYVFAVETPGGESTRGFFTLVR